MRIQQPADLESKPCVREQTQYPYQQPVAVNRRVPIVTAVESRMQLTRRHGIRIAIQHMRDVIRIFPRHVLQCHACEPRSRLLIQASHNSAHKSTSSTSCTVMGSPRNRLPTRAKRSAPSVARKRVSPRPAVRASLDLRRIFSTASATVSLESTNATSGPATCAMVSFSSGK